MTQERLEIPIDVDLTPMRTTLASLDTSVGKLNQISLAPLQGQFASLAKSVNQAFEIELPTLDPMVVSISANTEAASDSLHGLQTPLTTTMAVDQSAVQSSALQSTATLNGVSGIAQLDVDMTALGELSRAKSDLAQPIEIDISASGSDLEGITTSATDGLGAIAKATVHTQSAFEQISVGNVVGSLGETQSAFGTVSTAAAITQVKANATTKALSAVAIVLAPMRLLGNHFGMVSSTASLAADTSAKFSAGLGIISLMAGYVTIGLGLILAPLHGLIILPMLVIGAFALMFKAILAPFRAVFAVVSLVTKGVWALVQPFIALGVAVFKVKLFFTSLRLKMALLMKFMSFLPPKMRLVVVGLAAIGMSGRLGAAALKAVGFAALPAKAAFQGLKIVLSIMTLQFKSAVVNIVRLSMSLVQLTFRLGKFILKLAKLTFRGAISGMKSLGRATSSVAGKLGGKLVTSIASAIKWGAGLAAIGVGWGIKLAADAEQAQIAFKTMLKSGDAARVVLGKLEQFAASTPFQLKSLRDGAKQLLNAQVPATQLTNRLRMLGDIAAGTGKPIIDFVRIFAKVKSVGKVSLETLNQLAERGVPIYDALKKQLGKSRTEMLKMISKGKVGFAQLDGALRATATGAGVFAGGMAAQSQSVTGLFSTLKDNVGFAMRAIGVEVMAAFDFKSIMARGITFFQSLKAGIASAKPVFIAMATVVMSAFSAVWEVVAVTFNAITSALGLTGGNWMESFVVWAAVADFAFKSWPGIAELAFLKVGLFLVQLGAEFMHLFTVRIPAILTWFGENWKQLFQTAGRLYLSFFRNMHKNIFKAMKSIWAFIKSGGTSSLKFTWTPLLDGFKNTVKKLPDIPKRAIGQLERSMKADSKRLGSALSSGLATEIGKNLKMLDEFKLEQAQIKGPSLADIETPEPINVETANTEKSERKSTLVESLDRGSMEALKAIYEGQRQDQTAQKQLTVQHQIKNGIMKLVAKPVPEFDVAGAVS